MRLYILVLIFVVNLANAKDFIIPKDSDIRYCIENAPKVNKEFMYVKIESKKISDWFKQAFSANLDNTKKDSLLSSSVIVDIEDNIRNLANIVEDSSCKELAKNLEYSYKEALKRLENYKSLGIKIEQNKNFSYIVSDSTTNVYKEVLGEKKVIATLRQGAKLNLIKKAYDANGIEYGYFTFKVKKVKTLGWIKMSDVVADD
jgi:biotin operon repressor